MEGLALAGVRLAVTDKGIELLGLGDLPLPDLQLNQILEQAGDNLTRENVMKQAASLKNLKLPLLLPGMAINTSATDFAPIEQEGDAA